MDTFNVRTFLALTLVVLPLATACEGNTVALENSEGAAAQGSKPGDSCEFKQDPAVGPYGFCSYDTDRVGGTDYHSQCASGGAHAWSLDAERAGACRCLTACSVDADCPSPGSGDVEPECRRGSCALPCEGGKTCPDGQSCVLHSEQGSICAWRWDAENSLALRILEAEPPVAPEEVCGQFTTQGACEAELDADERQRWLACVWAKESIYAESGDAKPASSAGRCVVASLGFALPPEDGGPNRCGDRSVFWADLGAGTTALMEVERCGFAPVSVGSEPYYQPCELGDPSIPLLCDRGCQ